MRKLNFSFKSLLVAAGLLIGSANAWGDGVTMPSPIYLETFEDASFSGTTFTGSNSETGVQTGTGEIVEGKGAFGNYYQNKPTTLGNRANYLKINSTAFQTASIAANKTITLSFWVNTKYHLDNSFGTGWNAMFEAFTDAGFTAASGAAAFVESYGAFDIRTNTSSHALFANYNYHNTWDSSPAYTENTTWIKIGWHHIAYVLSDDEGKTHLNFYIDGVLNTNVDLAQGGEGTLWSNLSSITNYVLGGCSGEWSDPDAAFGYDDIAIYDKALTADQVKQIIDTKTAIHAIPSSFDFSSGDAYSYQIVAPFNENTVIKTGAGNTALALTAASATSTAWFDVDADKDGRQVYEIASNEKVTATFNVYCGWNGSNSSQTIALINDGGYTLASFTYETNPTNITDVKIGGATPAGFTASPSINNGNGFDKWNAVVVPQVVTITISGSRYVTLNVVNTAKSVDWSVSGTIDNALIDLNLAKITYSYSSTNFNNNRSMAIKSLALSTETVTEANVTYKYVDTSDNDLSSLMADKVAPATIGATIDDELIPASYKTSFLSGDENTKYVFSTFTSSDATVQAGGSTVTLKFAPKAKFTYTKRAMDGESVLNATLATGSAYEGETVTLKWPKYIENGGKWYVTNANYQSSSTSAATEDVAYTLSDVTQFVEATSSNWGTTSDSHEQYSNGIAYRGASAAKTIITVSEDGVYAVKYAVCSSSTGTDRKLNIYKNSADDANKLQDELTINWSYNYINSTGTKTIANVVLAKDETIVFKPNDSQVVLDYVALSKVTSVTATIGATGWSSFASPYALDLSGITGATAYYASAIDESNVTLTSTTATVPAGEGLMLKGTAGAAVTIPVAASGTEITGNKLVGCTVDTDIYGEDKYVLWSDGKFYNLENYTVGSPITIPAGKAYLNAEGVSLARALRIVFDDGEATGIAVPEVAEKAENGVLYNLNGQQVTADFKGIVIKNGKKYIQK